MRVFAIGLGTNLGDRLGYLKAALAHLKRDARMEVEAVSRVYETPPWGPPQPHYLNAAVRITTSLVPTDVLALCLEVEASLGRVRKERWGPRTIDLDVLYAEEDGRALAVSEVQLEVPHPRLAERAFALAPLLDVMPQLHATYGVRLAELGVPEVFAETLSAS